MSNRLSKQFVQQSRFIKDILNNYKERNKLVFILDNNPYYLIYFYFLNILL
jgi:hypothetical protein